VENGDSASDPKELRERVECTEKGLNEAARRIGSMLRKLRGTVGMPQPEPHKSSRRQSGGRRRLNPQGPAEKLREDVRP